MLDQVVLYTALSDGLVLGQVVAPYQQVLFTKHQRKVLSVFEDSLANDRARFNQRSQFDADLGWGPVPGQKRGRRETDWSGSRLGVSPLPRDRSDGTRLVGLVGCSFTFGTEVGNEETWARALDSAWRGTRFGNFGVGGYGIDQAYLRYRRDVGPLEPDEVWLGFFPNAAIRATSQFPPLYYPAKTRTIYFKPCFSLGDAGDLLLHPSPARRPEDVVRLIHNLDDFREAIGENDLWMARTPAAYAEPGAHWTHYSTFTRVLLTLYERRGRNVPAMLADESSEAFRLNRALMLALREEVEAAGSRFRILVLPGQQDVEEFAAEGRGYWQTLVQSLRDEGVELTFRRCAGGSWAV